MESFSLVAGPFQVIDRVTRSDTSGNWSATIIADLLGISVAELAQALNLESERLTLHPDGDFAQEALRPVAGILAMAWSQLNSGDSDETRARVYAWLRQEQSALGSESMLFGITERQCSDTIQKWLAAITLGLLE